MFLVRHADPLLGHHLLFRLRNFSQSFLVLFLLVPETLLLFLMVLLLTGRMRTSVWCLRTQKAEAPPPPAAGTRGSRVKLLGVEIRLPVDSFKLKYTRPLHQLRETVGGNSFPLMKK